MLKNALKKIT